MIVVKTIAELKSALEQSYQSGKTIGFIPTMGALHNGHLSLIEKSKNTCDVTVCSVFVNPTQFDEDEDLVKYPRVIEDDKELLISRNTDVLFVPSAEEMYPNGPVRISPFDFSPVDKVLEGAHRPGHFDGMAQIVKKLIDAVRPTHLFMGQKDYQQAAIVGLMIKKMQSDVNLVVCPIIREEDGLAMSSRNRRLKTAERKEAVVISQTIKWAKSQLRTRGISEIEAEAIMRIEANGMFQVDYFSIDDAQTLQKFDQIHVNQSVLISTAARIGVIRLIDNMLISNFAPAMLLDIFKSKIHRAIVTDANLNYIGSITIDRSLCEAVGILPNEKVQIVNCNNGERLETYVIYGKAGSGTICLNGAAARKVARGDIVIIIAYGQMTAEEATDFHPSTVFVDENNRIIH